MFTGLVEKIGTVCNITKQSNAMVLRIDTGSLSKQISTGDSVCINGACLTAAAISGTLLDFDVSPETVAVSTISSLRAADKVNIELAMTAQGRFGGHIVQGHVDGIGKIKSILNMGKFYEVNVSASPQLMKMMIPKGSVCINGISLTIASLDKDSFAVAVIPVTWKETNLQYLKNNDSVNIETDIIVKTINARLDNILNTKEANNSFTISKLREMGF